MPNFIPDNLTSYGAVSGSTFPKTDWRALTVPQSRGIIAQDWNIVAQALTDMRLWIVGAAGATNWLGFTEGSAPAPTGYGGSSQPAYAYAGTDHKLHWVANGVDTGLGSGGGGGSVGVKGAYQGGSASADNIIPLTSTLGPVLIRDNATPIGGSLFGVQDSAGTTKYIDATASGTTFGANVTLSTTKTLSAGSNVLIGSVADKLNAAHLAIASQAIGDLLTATSTTAFGRLAAVASGQVLTSAGTGTAPAYSASPSLTGATFSSTISVHGYTIDPGASTPTSNQALAWNGSAFVPTTISGGSGVTGSGTNNQIVAWNSAGTTIKDSSLADAGTGITQVQTVATSGSPAAWTLTGAAHTTLAASTEATDVNYNLARTVQFATGAIATQRAFRIQAPTYGFSGASTLTDAVTFYVDSGPVQGTNATITNSYAVGSAGPLALFAAAATSGSTTKNAPTFVNRANYWNGSVSTAAEATWQHTVTNATGPQSELDLTWTAASGTVLKLQFNPANRGVNDFDLVFNTNASKNQIVGSRTTIFWGGSANAGHSAILQTGGTGQTLPTQSNGNVIISAGLSSDANPGVIINTQTSASSAAVSTSKILSIQNGHSEKAYVTKDGYLGFITGNTQTTVGAAGTASALPGQPLGYMKMDVNGTTVAVPYYNAS